MITFFDSMVDSLERAETKEEFEKVMGETMRGLLMGIPAASGR